MNRIVLLRIDADAPDMANAIHLVTVACGGTVIHHDDKHMLADVPGDVDVFRRTLPGWKMSVQAPPLPLPDTRLRPKQ